MSHRLTAERSGKDFTELLEWHGAFIGFPNSLIAHITCLDKMKDVNQLPFMPLILNLLNVCNGKKCSQSVSSWTDITTNKHVFGLTNHCMIIDLFLPYVFFFFAKIEKQFSSPSIGDALCLLIRSQWFEEWTRRQHQTVLLRFSTKLQTAFSGDLWGLGRAQTSGELVSWCAKKLRCSIRCLPRGIRTQSRSLNTVYFNNDSRPTDSDQHPPRSSTKAAITSFLSCLWAHSHSTGRLIYLQRQHRVTSPLLP